MDVNISFVQRRQWLVVARLRERLVRLGGPAPAHDRERQVQYLYRLSRRVRDPRDLLRWYANDSML